VLVGHSYGGAVICNAAAHNDEVKPLVYVNAVSAASRYSRAKDKELNELTAKFPGSAIAQASSPCRSNTPTAPGHRTLLPAREVRRASRPAFPLRPWP
jgi:pimeloyl-ACP methyl ester carboxylesterase